MAAEAQLESSSTFLKPRLRVTTLISLLTDIAVVDMSDVGRQPSLFYHLGVRESFDMANNVILYHDTDPDTAQSLKVSRGCQFLARLLRISYPSGY